jgi:hypothetical protein
MQFEKSVFFKTSSSSALGINLNERTIVRCNVQCNCRGWGSLSEIMQALNNRVDIYFSHDRMYVQKGQKMFSFETFDNKYYNCTVVAFWL